MPSCIHVLCATLSIVLHQSYFVGTIYSSSSGEPESCFSTSKHEDGRDVVEGLAAAEKCRSHKMSVTVKTPLLGHSEKTFIAVKPDGIKRGLIGKIVKRFEKRGYKLIAMKMVQPSEALIRSHYQELQDRPFFEGLVKYMVAGPVVAMVWEGFNIVTVNNDHTLNTFCAPWFVGVGF